MIKRLLIANRGEIACRIIKTCKEMAIETVAVYSTCEKNHRHVQLADDAVCVGDCDVSESYLNANNIISAALLKKCDAIHPGYGLLSEHALFAQQVIEAGLIFIGPSTEAIALTSNKLSAKMLCQTNQIPVISGSRELIQSRESASYWANEIGYPLVVKSNQSAGGQRVYIVNDQQALFDKIKSIQSFNEDVFLEKYVVQAKHIEVQLCADHFGNMVHFGLRDCSLQIHHKKVIEESFNSMISKEKEDQIIADAIKISKLLRLDHVFTIEFLLDADGHHAFLEANPRIQVEHSISEVTTNIDLIQLQIECANKQTLNYLQHDIKPQGHAIECRIVAEDPRHHFSQCEGQVVFLKTPNQKHVRVDLGVNVNDTVLPYYDHLIMKIIVFDHDRKGAIKLLRQALLKTIVVGVQTNISFLQAVLAHRVFTHDQTSTQTMHQIHQSWLNKQQPKQDHVICQRCQKVYTKSQLEASMWVCQVCEYHWNISASSTIRFISDEQTFVEMDQELVTSHHHLTKTYQDKLNQAKQQAQTNEAIVTGVATIGGISVCLGIMEPLFMMGTMGSVVGEKLTRIIERAHQDQMPLIIVVASGGARMQEGIESLMQMAKVTCALTRFQSHKGLFISILTHPTMGGTTASFATQGDIILAFPSATIGFSGERVIKQALHQQFDEQIQQAEVLLSNGWIDAIVSRLALKETLEKLLCMHQIKSYHFKQEKLNLSKSFAKSLSSWQTVQQARDSQRIKSDQVISQLFDMFVSLHDASIDGALLGGIALLDKKPITVLAHQKGNDLKSNIHHRFGMVAPIGHRKIKRLVLQAEKFNRPIITIIDTPGAYPSMASELFGQATSISDSLALFSQVKVPVIAIVLSEGGSGGALALGIADVVLMCEHAYYSVISPEGYASILYRDDNKAEQAAQHMNITADKLLQMGIIDGIIDESNQSNMVLHMKQLVIDALKQLMSLSSEALVDNRFQRYRSIASVKKDQ